MMPPKKLLDVSFDREGAAKAVEAAMARFEAACWRARPGGLVEATEAVHVAVQEHMDAIASQIGVSKQIIGGIP